MKNMKKEKVYRHGEIGFRVINKLPDGLKRSETNVIMSGSHGNSHSFKNGDLFLKNVDQYVFGYFVAQNTILLHAEHGKNIGSIREAILPDGIYEIRKQNEYINNELKPVID